MKEFDPDGTGQLDKDQFMRISAPQRPLSPAPSVLTPPARRLPPQ